MIRVGVVLLRSLILVPFVDSDNDQWIKFDKAVEDSVRKSEKCLVRSNHPHHLIFFRFC